jgi:hypothetical protein
MSSVVSKAYVSSNILVGPANVYLGIAPPPSNTPPTADVNEISIDANGQPATAYSTGATTNGATPDVITFPTFASYTPSDGDILTVSSVTTDTAANGAWTVTGVTVTTSTTSATLVGSIGGGSAGSGGVVKVGQHLGLNEGPTKLSIHPTFVEIRADQLESPIDAALTKVEAEIDIVTMEFDPLTYQRWFTADTVTNPALLANSRVTTFGGQFTDASNLRTLLLISPDRKQVGRWIYVLGFKAYLKSAIPLQFHRTAHAKYALKFGLVGDFTRKPGDELLHFVRTH